MRRKHKKSPKDRERRMRKGLRESLISAGFGGQGIMLLGKLLSYAAMREHKEVTWMPSYGAEVRGGTAHSMVVISTTPIASPVVTKPSSCIIMNRPSFLKFEQKIIKGGLFIINSSLIKDKARRRDIKVVRIPATEIACELGNVKAANMVILGAYLRRKKGVSLKTVISCLKDVFASKDTGLIGLNRRALLKGWGAANVGK